MNANIWLFPMIWGVSVPKELLGGDKIVISYSRRMITVINAPYEGRSGTVTLAVPKKFTLNIERIPPEYFTGWNLPGWEGKTENKEKDWGKDGIEYLKSDIENTLERQQDCISRGGQASTFKPYLVYLKGGHPAEAAALAWNPDITGKLTNPIPPRLTWFDGDMIAYSLSGYVCSINDVTVEDLIRVANSMY